MRNVVPRQGTETCNLLRCRVLLRIEKCSSPTGDGNCTPYPLLLKDNFIEKCSSPTGDGNHFPMRIMRVTVIEKCSSPTGDGNRRKRYPPKPVKLRNVVPRQGTETNSSINSSGIAFSIEKCSSPTGDGNTVKLFV